MRSERELLYEQAIKRYAYAAAAPCGAARVPAAGSAGGAGADGVDRTRHAGRGYLCTVHRAPLGSLRPGLGAAVPGLADRGLADPVFAVGHAGHSHSGLRARGGRFLHPPAAGGAVPAVGPDASLGGGWRGLGGRHPYPDQHDRFHRGGAGADGGLVLPLPEAGKAGLASAGGRLCRQRGSRLRAGVLRLFAVRRDGEPWHPAGRLDAGPLLPLLWRHHQLSDQPDQSGN